MILRGALPQPVSDNPAVRVRRDRAVMAVVGALLPVNAAEGRLAAMFVVAETWAMDCLRQARERRLEFRIVHQCRAQAISMMREAKSTLRELARMQAKRAKRDGNENEQAAWVEHGVVEMMAEALREEGDAEAAESCDPTSPVAEPAPVPAPVPKPVQAAGDDRAGMATPDARVFRAISKYTVESHGTGFETGVGRVGPIPPPGSGSPVSGLEPDSFS